MCVNGSCKIVEMGNRELWKCQFQKYITLNYSENFSLIPHTCVHLLHEKATQEVPDREEEGHKDGSKL